MYYSFINFFVFPDSYFLYIKMADIKHQKMADTKNPLEGFKILKVYFLTL